MGNIELDNRYHEPVKLKEKRDMGDIEYSCPLCGIVIMDTFNLKRDNKLVFDVKKSKYCPNCGVKFL